MTVKNYYELLGIDPAASPDEVKRAFRQQIARYHPDKVQHLGKEFQEMAAERAAELTESYRILSDPKLREQYNRSRDAAAASAPPAPGAAQGQAPAQGQVQRQQPAAEPAPPPHAGEPVSPPGDQFVHERATRDEFVRKATLGRFRQALAVSGGTNYDETQVHGFDLACVPKSKLFARKKRARLLMRFVPSVDAQSVADTWAQASKWTIPAGEEICVFLIGPAIARPRELADAISDRRSKTVRGAAKVTLIPVDMRDWQAHIPIDAPAEAKSLLDRLRAGA